MLNATTRSTQSIPVIIDVSCISRCRRHLFRRREVGLGSAGLCVDWFSGISAPSEFVCVLNGDLLATASGTRMSVSVSASGSAKASLLMPDCDTEDLRDRTE